MSFSQPAASVPSAFRRAASPSTIRAMKACRSSGLIALTAEASGVADADGAAAIGLLAVAIGRALAGAGSETREAFFENLAPRRIGRRLGNQLAVIGGGIGKAAVLFLRERQPDARLFRVRGNDENALKGFLGILRNDAIFSPDPRVGESLQPPRRFSDQPQRVCCTPPPHPHSGPWRSRLAR